MIMVLLTQFHMTDGLTYSVSRDSWFLPSQFHVKGVSPTQFHMTLTDSLSCDTYPHIIMWQFHVILTQFDVTHTVSCDTYTISCDTHSVSCDTYPLSFMWQVVLPTQFHVTGSLTHSILCDRQLPTRFHVTDNLTHSASHDWMSHPLSFIWQAFLQTQFHVTDYLKSLPVFRSDRLDRRNGEMEFLVLPKTTFL